MKEDKQGKPVYESPKVYKLDETESAYGSDCESGSAPLDSCGIPGQSATGCGNPGMTATTACAAEGQNPWA